MIMVEPSAGIRRNYNDVAELCNCAGGPVYLAKNGESELAVINVEAFERRESMLRLREDLVAVAENRLEGRVGNAVDRVSVMMKAAVQKVQDGHGE